MKAKKILAVVLAAAAAVFAMMTPVSAVKEKSGAPTEKEVINLIKKSTDRNFLYNAEKAGLTRDILAAFFASKKVSTLEASSGNFSIEIDKEDISDRKALIGADISAGGNILTDKQIKKYNVLKNSAEVIQINLNGSGIIKGVDKFNIRTRIRTKITGPAKAVVYEYKNKKLKKVSEAGISESGNISFSTDHLGKYIVSVETGESVPDKAPTEKEVIKLISESSGGNVLYDAKKAGITKGILSAFIENKRADSVEARTDKFSVEIDREDITDKKVLTDIDISAGSGDMLTAAQIKKYKELKDSREVVQLDLNGSGKIKGIRQVKIHTRASELIDGSTAVVYELSGNKLKKIALVKVSENGDIFFTSDRLGKFVIAVK